MTPNAKEVKTITVDGEELCLIREESGLLFALDASYVEQGVGTIHSPYGHGVVALDDDDFDIWIVSGREWGDDDDTVDFFRAKNAEAATDAFWESFDVERTPENEDAERVIVVTLETLGDFLAKRPRADR